MELLHYHVLGVFERGLFEEAVQEDYAAQNVLSGKCCSFIFNYLYFKFPHICLFLFFP